MNRGMDRRAVLRGGLGLAAAAVGGSSLAACTVGEQTAPTTKAKRNLVIVQWTNVPAVEVTKKINAAFEKENPGVTVTMRHAPNPNNAYGALVNSQLAAKSVDIIAQFPLTPSAFPPKYTKQKPGGFAALVAAGKAVDLKDAGFMKRYDKSQQQYAFGYEGGQYALMAAQYPAYGGLFYKKALLEKHNVALPSTWDELIQAFDTLKSKGVTPVFLAAKDGYQAFIWHGILTQTLMAGKPAESAAEVGAARAEAFWQGTVTWNDPLHHEVAAKYLKVMQYTQSNASGVSALTAPGVWAVKEDDFPFLIDGTFDAATIVKANPKLDLGFFTMPSSNDAAVNRVVLNPDLSWVVPTSAPNKDLAMKWLEFFSREDNYKQWLTATGSNSTQPGVTTNEVPWMDWLNEHQEGACLNIPGPWIPTGAAPEAGGPVLGDMVPIGKTSVNDELRQAADAYAKARKA
ncbi:ABC transporter substrate-binding protein [Actinopolymorpha alba]|uniref:ABC transporter substrate-binding protein n=1 Tax=Actinopolymorpha alba TaxID=533267 RepID=UPI000361F75B|nr:extracellular solute-binding protein [Actinopolymorpha alba]